jgi:hypothetical protein
MALEADDDPWILKLGIVVHPGMSMSSAYRILPRFLDVLVEVRTTMHLKPSIPALEDPAHPTEGAREAKVVVK